MCVFREFIGVLDPLYLPHLPSRQMLSDKLVPELYEELRADIRTQLSQVASPALSLELWTNERLVLDVTDTFLFDFAKHILCRGICSCVLLTVNYNCLFVFVGMTLHLKFDFGLKF